MAKKLEQLLEEFRTSQAPDPVRLASKFAHATVAEREQVRQFLVDWANPRKDDRPVADWSSLAPDAMPRLRWRNSV